MLDAIVLEKRGIPAAAIGPRFLVDTVGLAMKKLHGMAGYPVATYAEIDQGDALLGVGIAYFQIEEVAKAGELSDMAKTLASQIEAILVHKT